MSAQSRPALVHAGMRAAAAAAPSNAQPTEVDEPALDVHRDQLDAHLVADVHTLEALHDPAFDRHG